MLIILLSLSYAENPCYELLNKKGKRYKRHTRCSRSMQHNPVDDKYTCNITTHSARYTCDLHVSDTQCPFRAILAIAFNERYKDTIITTLEEIPYETK